MPLLTLADAELHYGELPLLDRAALTVQAGERIGLIGRNGTGKSSLLGILAGTVALDDGELKKTDGLRIVRVEQEPALPESSGVEPHKLERFLHLLQVTPGEAMSGGERKRAALAHAFAQEPDLLLLDEPTNHLDIDGILQLENLLLKAPAAIVVTHDRAFLDRVATRIVELDCGRLLSYSGNYSSYEKTKAAQLASEAVTQRKFDKFWAQEEAGSHASGARARRSPE
jgi:ATP-binding cassette subfamily F protein uup